MTNSLSQPFIGKSTVKMNIPIANLLINFDDSWCYHQMFVMACVEESSNKN